MRLWAFVKKIEGPALTNNCALCVLLIRSSIRAQDQSPPQGNCGCTATWLRGLYSPESYPDGSALSVTMRRQRVPVLSIAGSTGTDLNEDFATGAYLRVASGAASK